MVGPRLVESVGDPEGETRKGRDIDPFTRLHTFRTTPDLYPHPGGTTERTEGSGVGSLVLSSTR